MIAKANKYLIIGGSTKCGTTSVFNYFEFHPQVCACTMKESRYFWTGEYEITSDPRKKLEVKSFSELFKNCKSGQLLIEATPDYLYSESSALKIKSEIPDCKFVFILRDPVSRLISWYNYARLNDLIPRQTTFDGYVTLQHSSGTDAPQHMRALEQGRYAGYIGKYVKVFGENNVMVNLYDDLKTHPEEFCRSIARFAGIDENYFKGFDFKVFNKTVDINKASTYLWFRKFKRTVRPVTRILHPSIRKKLKLAGLRFEHSYQRSGQKREGESIVISPDQYQFLHQYYHDDRLQLQTLLGRTIHW